MCFERRQVSNAAFIHPALIVDDENITRLRGPHRFEEDVHAAIVSHGQAPTGDMVFNGQWMDARGGELQREIETEAGICTEWGGKCGERFV